MEEDHEEDGLIPLMCILCIEFGLDGFPLMIEEDGLLLWKNGGRMEAESGIISSANRLSLWLPIWGA
jgi:hypothetical protein